MTAVINPNTRLNIILDLNTQVVDYIVSLNPHDFERLYNPLMRKFMAPRITLGRIAAMTNRPVGELLQRIAALADVEIAAEDAPTYPQSPLDAPAWVREVSMQTMQVVNLLPIDETLDADPMPPISRAIKRLADDEVLLIQHKWEPQPLYDIWSRIGIDWYAQQISPDEWWVWVKRGKA